jgi:hypothetical protein
MKDPKKVIIFLRKNQIACWKQGRKGLDPPSKIMKNLVGPDSEA